MYIIYLSVLLIVIFGIVAIISLKRKHFEVFLHSASLFILSLFLFGALEGSKPSKVYIEEQLNYYNNLKEQIDVVKKLQNKEFKDIFEDDLTEKMNKMNRIIRSNKNYNSKWAGSLCSEEIGNLEELKW